MTHHEIVDRLDEWVRYRQVSTPTFSLFIASTHINLPTFGIRPKWHKHWDTPIKQSGAAAKGVVKS